MKYFFCLFILLFPHFIFANDAIDISLSQEKIHLGQEFQLDVRVQISDTSQTELSLEIP